jgi:hypothetical protein
MQISGLNVDTKKIGRGMYEIICQMEQEAIVAFGMIPIEINDILEKMLREKMLDIAASQRKMSREEFDELVSVIGGLDERMIKRTIDEVIREIIVEIFRAASEAGKMLC